MCGICLVIFYGGGDVCRSDIPKLNFDCLKKRGPDSWLEKSIHNSAYCLHFFGSVLQMQGNLTKQPLEDNLGNILLWNGEIFGGINIEKGENDSKKLLDILSKAITNDEILHIFSMIKGPWSFLYWQDVDYTEVASLGLYCLSVNSSNKPKLFPWSHINEERLFAEDSLYEKNKHFCDIQTEKLIPPFDKFNFDLPTELDDINLKQCAKRDISTIDDLTSIISEDYWTMSNSLLQKLSDSVRIRISNHQNLCGNCIKENNRNCEHAKIAVLFSGGIDSLIIAALCHSHLVENEAIDLINVAFSADNSYSVPDRLTGLKSFKQLQKMYPNRKFNFITVDVSLSDLREARQSTIANLIKPLRTVLDDSIACAIWFAANGIGCVGEKLYKSSARVILTGMGSDEQLAGYSRHRMNNGNWDNLAKEVDMDIRRISARNLGRDDRIITDHGKEARFPFLDEGVVSFLNSLPIWKKTNLYQEKGIGDKLLLRLAAIQLGLQECSLFVKRAIQFGSRIAKLESRNEKASDICERLN
ncbi:DgyrCDS12049 [Dimorphilus gyrociliatus]|uniref:DgyrCDS12049 n=1 Tax=Dimorphilus gyrociliatus TaxID=2664684 RepID=A0A7I8W6J6_9ANNE|nr:DgyrCDS12049 [Dimorphilus gyrociliatus]